MINGIRHGIERLAHGREFLTVILWKLDAEILLCDLLELKRHFLKRTESMHYGKNTMTAIASSSKTQESTYGAAT